MAREVERLLRKYVQGPLEIQVRGRKASVQVDETEIAPLIGKGGKTVQSLERKLGLHLSITALRGAPRRDRDDDRHLGGMDGDEDVHRSRSRHERRGGAHDVPKVRVKKTSTNVFLLVDGARPGVYRVEVEGAIVGEAVASKEGRLRFKADSPEGQAIAAAEKSGLEISVVQAE
jgi:predicted PilT family ATPase